MRSGWRESARSSFSRGSHKAPAHPSTDVYAWARVVGYLLTGKTSGEKTLAVEPAWRAILAPCVDFQPANRPAVAALRAELGRLGR